MRYYNYLALQLVFWAGMVSQAVADRPFQKPASDIVWSSDRRFYAVMDPDTWTTTVYRSMDGGHSAKSWAMYDWFRASYLADDGEHFVAFYEGTVRGRHMRDTGRTEEAKRDYLLARHLFPQNRKSYIDTLELAIGQGTLLFDPGEFGSPQSLGEWLNSQYPMSQTASRRQPKDFLSTVVSFRALL